MSITFTIDATLEELNKLESEGAPSCNFSNTNAFSLFDALRVEFDYVGCCDADELVAAIETCLLDPPPHHVGRLNALLEVARAAERLDREVSWA